MKRQSRLSARAKTQIEDIYNFTKSKFGVEQADKYVSELIEDIDLRANNPMPTSRAESNLASRLKVSEIRSFLYRRIHRCYFTFDEEILFVLAIYHGARNPEKIDQFLRQSIGELGRPDQ